MRIAKGVIVAGEGQCPITWSAGTRGVRHLFPVANRPILFHHLEGLRRAGLLEVRILADGRGRDAIATAVGDGRQFNLEVRVEESPAEAGLAGTLARCAAFAGGEPLLVQQADTLLHGRLSHHVAAFDDDRLDALGLRVEGELARVESGYLLSPRAQQVLMRGAGEAGNPLGEVRASGGRVRVASVAGTLPSDGAIDSLLDANRAALSALEASPGPVGEGCRVQGVVVVHPSADVRRSTLRGPLVIGPDAIVADAYVGPYTSIGAGARVEGAEVEHAILLPGAELLFVGARIESSVIGASARVARGFARPSSLRMWIGDGSEVLLT
jgi:glucose-1-phosphate thymidylyltransferase